MSNSPYIENICNKCINNKNCVLQDLEDEESCEVVKETKKIRLEKAS